MLNGNLPKFQNVQPCVERAVRALAVVNLDVALLRVAVQGAAVNAENLAGSCDSVPSCWLDVRLSLCHRSPPSFPLRPELASSPCLWLSSVQSKKL